MSQHDMDVANGPGLTFRTDMNAALQALASQSSGASVPNPTFPCQLWGDTGSGRLKQRNSANTAWLDRGALDSLGDLPLSGGTMAGPINDAATQTIASATLTGIGAATSNVVAISGTTTITGLGTIAAGARRTVRFLGSLILTYNAASLILPTTASITTAANDTAEFLSLGSGNWICLRYTLASGKAPAFTYDRSNALGTVSQVSGVPTGALMEYGTNAQGQYWKFASGLMICTIDTIFAGGTVANGSVFRSVVAAIGSLPSNFVVAPSVFPLGYSVSAGGGWAGLQASNSASTWGSWSVYSSTALSGNLALSLLAIGRWF